jgi:hypothetical protein
MVPKPHYLNALFPEILGTGSIIFSGAFLCVLTAVEFHCKPGFRAVKVQDIRAGAILASEFQAIKTSIADLFPECLFSFCLMEPELPTPEFQQRIVANHNNSPLPAGRQARPLLPQEGECPPTAALLMLSYLILIFPLSPLLHISCCIFVPIIFEVNQ